MLFFKVGNLRLILGENLFFFLEITMIFRQKVGNLRLILGEDLFFLEIKVKMALGSKTLDFPYQ